MKMTMKEVQMEGTFGTFDVTYPACFGAITSKRRSVSGVSHHELLMRTHWLHWNSGIDFPASSRPKPQERQSRPQKQRRQLSPQALRFHDADSQGITLPLGPADLCARSAQAAFRSAGPMAAARQETIFDCFGDCCQGKGGRLRHERRITMVRPLRDPSPRVCSLTDLDQGCPGAGYHDTRHLLDHEERTWKDGLWSSRISMARW